MKITLASTLVLLVIILNNCKQPSLQLSWSDEFDYSGKPDTTKWGYDYGSENNGWGNNEKQYYTDSSANARVENGILIIEAHKDSINGFAYTSARLVSRNKGDWTYGRFEIKARLAKGRGTWSALWMLPTEWKYGGWPESGEIDIMEHVGYDGGVIHGTAHSVAYNHIKQTHKESTITIADAEDAFHVYALDWSMDKMDFYVDDKLFHTITRDENATFNEWPFDQKFYLLLNVAVGGNWGGKEGVDDSIWPQRMEVDYVRVYQ